MVGRHPDAECRVYTISSRKGTRCSLSERFLAAMALSETTEQQEVAREIYDRLAAGADVDDVRPLIEEMMTIVVRQRQEVATHPQSFGNFTRRPQRLA